MTVGVQLLGAPLDLGFVAALAYFGLLRPRLVAAVPTLPTLAEPPAGSGSPAELRRRSPCQRHAGLSQAVGERSKTAAALRGQRTSR
jgi:hypothetical protein